MAFVYDGGRRNAADETGTSPECAGIAPECAGTSPELAGTSSGLAGGWKAGGASLTRRAACLGACACACAVMLCSCDGASGSLFEKEEAGGRGAWSPVASEASRQASSNVDDNRGLDDNWGFWMRTESCVGCGSCADACELHSGTPSDRPRRTVRSYSFDNGEKRNVSVACMHCEKPGCLEVCPAGAISKRTDGVVVVDKDHCLGCRYCSQGCPFDVPKYGEDGMDKCDYCTSSGVISGDAPWCVRACPTGALNFGTLSQMRAMEGAELHRIQAPTKPVMFLS